LPLINIKGADIYYQLVETHPCRGTLLFIHGAGSTHEVWENQLENLPRGFQGLALDLPAHGKSQGDSCKSIEEFAGFIIEFLKHMELIRPLYLCGHSMGAAISLYTARYFPDYIDGIILIGGSSTMKVYPKVLEDLSNGIINPDFIRVTFAPMTDPGISESTIETFLHMPTDVFYNDLNSCDQFEFTGELSRIQKPALIIASKWDRLTPVKHCKKLTLIDNSSFAVINDAGHFMILEKPHEVNRLIADFLKEESSA